MNKSRISAMAAGLLALGAGYSLANPDGGQVAAGSASINTVPGTVTVQQQSNTAIINWQNFSIGAGEATKFIQPSSTSAVLNRVLGGNVSAIYGTLSANGQVYLINPNGVLIGPGGMVNTAGFTASTRDIADSDFLSGNFHFTGGSAAGVQNLGTINALGGDVYFIGHTVHNQGTINAPNGTVGLAAGDDVLITQGGPEKVFVSPVAAPASGAGQTGVHNSGTITATAAELKAANGNIYALAINNEGAIRATTVQKTGGRIFLVSDTGTVANSGTLDASSTAAGSTGGSVLVKTSGTAIHTGAILARGGNGGAGGSVEVSGKTGLTFTGTVDTTAPNGQTGTLTIDPAVITVMDTPTLAVITGGTSTVAFDSSTSDYRNDGSSTTIDPTTVVAALANNDVVLNADNSITVTNGITWTTANTLTLSTNNSGSTITINAPISGVNGTLAIFTAGTSDLVTTGSAGTIHVATFLMQQGQWSQVAASLPAFAATNDFEISPSSASFLRATGGNGSASTPYAITDVYGLQGIASLPLGNAYVLANNISASGTSTWNSGEGFNPIGASNGFTGIFDGQGFTINGLFINMPTLASVGLFGNISDAVVDNVAVTNANVTGDRQIGLVVGYAIDSLVDHASSSGSATGVGGFDSADDEGNCWTGGVVGFNDVGTVVNNCQSSATVMSNFVAGGLVGENDGTVQFGSSSGHVSGTNFAGGLVGGNFGTISDSLSSASVTSPGDSTNNEGFAGGLSATIEAGSISNSFSTGPVTSVLFPAGGLVGGFINGPATDSFWDETTSGITSTNGAGTPEPTSFFFNQANYPASWDFTNVWFPPMTNYPQIRPDAHYLTSPSNPGGNSSDSANSAVAAFDAYTANGALYPPVFSFFPVVTGIELISVDDPNSDGGAVNNGSGSGQRGGDIASGSSTSGAVSPNRLLTAGSGINSIFNGGVSNVQPPAIVIQKFQTMLDFGTHNELHDAAFGSH
jgi:filamentous hemagglutinin family protein